MVPGRAWRDHVAMIESTAPIDTDVHLRLDRLDLGGRLTIPAKARGVVLFAHGSGSSRHSPRNRAVAEVVQHAGIGTLLFDLLTDEEAADRARVFDIDLLALRLISATRWLRDERSAAALPVGYFGASTGAAAALRAATETDVAAVVSRGGRPDLAGEHLRAVRCPTLLIVGGADREVLALNERAAAELGGPYELRIVAGATHLFEEPGALEEVARLASEWFRRHLVPNAGA
jgi:putative phosphoribosyl transferase